MQNVQVFKDDFVNKNAFSTFVQTEIILN